MKTAYLILMIILIQQAARAMDAETTKLPKSLQSIYSNYEEGEFTEALRQLKVLATEVGENKELVGLMEYWKALCWLKLSEYKKAIKSLETAQALEFQAPDLHYHLGQAFFASKDYEKARKAFRQSAKNNFKVAVSLYYVAYTSQKMSRYKTAVFLYKGIEKLPDHQKREIAQASRMQLGDIYLTQLKKKPHGIDEIESYVLSNYRSALEWDEKSYLAPQIVKRIKKLEREYGQVLFQLRNGRPINHPPYFLKANMKYLFNSNVNALHDEFLEIVGKERNAASANSYGAYGRYSFYPNSAFSLTPQLNFSTTRYNSPEKYVTQNDTLNLTASLQTSYEHFFNREAASLFLEVAHTYNEDDSDRDGQLEKSNEILTVSASEQLEIWKSNPSTFTIKHDRINALNSIKNKEVYSASLQQMISLSRFLLFAYSEYGRHQFQSSNSLNHTRWFTRIDLIYPSVFNWFNFNPYIGYSRSEYVEDKSRESTKLTTLGANFNRPMGKSFYLYFDIAQNAQTGNWNSDNYKQQIYTVNLDYIF